MRAIWGLSVAVMVACVPMVWAAENKEEDQVIKPVKITRVQNAAKVAEAARDAEESTEAQEAVESKKSKQPQEAKEPQETAMRIVVSLVDGSRIVATPLFDTVPLECELGKLEIKIDQISQIERKGEKCALSLRNGDRVSGSWEGNEIEIETLIGKLKVPLDKVVAIAVRAEGSQVGVVLHYSFNKDEGGKVTDESGSGHDGVVRGASFVKDGNGGAYRVGRRAAYTEAISSRTAYIDSVSRRMGYIETDANDAWSFGTKPFSIALWVKFESQPYGEQGLVGCDEGGGERNKWVFECHSGTVDFHINNPRSESYRIAPFQWTPTLGTWYQLAVTREGSAYRIFIDGKCVSTDKNDLPVPTASAPLTIGQAEGLAIDGTIDEVMIFNRCLSPEDVQGIFSAGR